MPRSASSCATASLASAPAHDVVHGGAHALGVAAVVEGDRPGERGGGAGPEAHDERVIAAVATGGEADAMLGGVDRLDAVADEPAPGAGDDRRQVVAYRRV